MNKNLFVVIFLGIFLLGSLLRFYKLDWGEGLYAHPDEYHIVASVNQLSFPHQMHPHFFSYGTAIIYPIYFTKAFVSFLQQNTNYEEINANPFLIGRFYSALFSSLTILVVYGISRSILSRSWSILAMFFVAFTPGLIQQAHFATPESILTCYLLFTLYLLLQFIKKKKPVFLITSGVFLGIAMGVKIVAILFAPLILFACFLKLGKTLFRALAILVTSLLAMLASFAIVALYVFLDNKAFMGNVKYEGSVASGESPVFYTRQFIDTIHVVFHLEKIFPFTLGPFLTISAIAGLLFLIIYTVKKFEPTYFFIIIAFFLLFIPNVFLFAKWTRFIAPAFPFFGIFAAFFLSEIAKRYKKLSYALMFIVLLATACWAMAFFSIYTRNDVRVSASDWLEANIAQNSSILVEGGNTIDLPLKGDFKRMSLDFYAFEEDLVMRRKIIDALFSSDYFFIQSRRVFVNHQRLPHLFPKTAKLYDALFDGSLGFEQIKEFHSYPQFSVGSWKLEIPDENAEETWSVFDHPVIRVFQKTKKLPKETYAKIFE